MRSIAHNSDRASLVIALVAIALLIVVIAVAGAARPQGSDPTHAVPPHTTTLTSAAVFGSPDLLLDVPDAAPQAGSAEQTPAGLMSGDVRETKNLG